MTFEEYTQSLKLTSPPQELSPLLKALWYEAHGNWEAAHDIAQSKEGTRTYDRLHAYLHRVEGDTWNAGYWYRKAGADIFQGGLKDEWKELVQSML